MPDTDHAQQPHLCYCTNVHAGTTLKQTLANLERYALPVKQRVSPDAPMGVGLWLSAQAARQVVETDRAIELRHWLDERGLCVRTLNGFPHGDFHETVVKHRVYEPDWRNPARVTYTRDLIAILVELLPDESEGGISTLPIGWRSALADDPEALRAAAGQLTELVHHLARVELDTGKLIHIDLEPEPGCALTTADDVTKFFQRHLLGTPDDISVRSYLRVCHDVCHAAVMFEDQAAVFAQYKAVGIEVGKVQVSSAIDVDFEQLDDAQREAAMNELRAFAEDRYLHQTVVREPGGQTSFYEDLPQALTTPPRGHWRVHFHIPLFLENFGSLSTTQSQISIALQQARQAGVQIFEAETYAWNVLPEPLRQDDLAHGIAREIQWLQSAMPAEHWL